MTFSPEEVAPPGANIKVIGIGGGGGNAINTMIREKIEGVQFISVNTDIQALRSSLAPIKIQIGKELTKGLGAGADPDIGRDAALEDRHAIQEALVGAHMVFVTAGMGGGTGTGGISILAQIAKEIGALTVGVVTKPFDFEGKRRRRLAQIGINQLSEYVDTLITIPNQRLLQVANPDLSMIEAFQMVDNVLVNAVKGISDIINVPGMVNVDFADVKTVMASMGLALMGIGIGTGENRAAQAAHQAISSPLLEDIDIEGATGILINISAPQNITLKEVNHACSIIQEAAHENANIIFGTVIDEKLDNEIRVTVIATGFPSEEITEDIPSNQRIKVTNSKYHVEDESIAGISNIFKKSISTNNNNHLTPNNASQKPHYNTNKLDYNDNNEQEKNEISRAEPEGDKAFETTPNTTLSSEFNDPDSHKTCEFEPNRLAQLTINKSHYPLESDGSSANKDESLATKAPVANGDDLMKPDTPPVNMDPQPNATHDRLNGASAYDSINQDKELSTTDNAPNPRGRQVDINPSNMIAGPHPLPAQNSETNTQEGEGPSVTQGASNSDDTGHHHKSSINEKIDAAIDLADRINKDLDNPQEDDELDVPAFLRNGMKDLSLS